MFEEFLVTDGLSVAVTVSQDKPTDTTDQQGEQAEEVILTAKEMELLREQKELECVQSLYTNCDHLVAVDPGCKPIISAVVHDSEAELSVNLPTGRNIKHEVLKMSQKQFYTDTGYTLCNKKNKRVDTRVQPSHYIQRKHSISQDNKYACSTSAH
jgi:hypothetical protein